MFKPNALEISWNELNEYVLALKQSDPHRRIWGEVERKPLTAKSIEVLIADGWTLDTGHIAALCNPEKKEITLDKKMLSAENYWERDTALFHELHHAWYGEELADNWERVMIFRKAEQNNRITEWLGRKARTDSELLRHAVLSFNLEPGIYDKPSYEAFRGPVSSLKKQKIFPFAEKYYSRFRETRMELKEELIENSK